MKNKKKLLIPLILALFGLFVFGTTYAFFSANVTSVNKTDTVLKAQSLTLTFRGQNEVVNCSNIIPGDKCIKTFDVENTSSVSTYYNIYMEDISNGFDSFLVYTLKEGNTEVIPETVTPGTRNGKTYILANVTIPANTTKSYTLTIEYKYSSTVDQSNTQGHEFRTKVGIDTVQAAVVPVNYNGKKCMRATELHTEECAQTSDYCAGAGYTASGSKGTTTITYGNLGTSGTLASGDAFDCDINGDNLVDDNERFYYVSTATNGITQDANTAVLIYYNDYVTSPVAYALQADTGLSTDSNEKGPVTAIKNLPTINDWSTRLTSTTRDITYENNVVRVSNFQYKKDGTDLAARLLTTQELESACNITVGSRTTGELDGCNYLMENTRYASSSNPTYGTWLETARSSNSSSAWSVDGYGRRVDRDSVNYASGLGARPAIEVAKTDIEY